MHFDQFKEALILILSRTLSNKEHFQEPGKDTTCFLFVSLRSPFRAVQGGMWGPRSMSGRDLGHLPVPDWAVISSGLSFDINLKALQLLNTKMRLPTTAIWERNNCIVPRQYVRWWAITHIIRMICPLPLFPVCMERYAWGRGEFCWKKGGQSTDNHI